VVPRAGLDRCGKCRPYQDSLCAILGHRRRDSFLYLCRTVMLVKMYSHSSRKKRNLLKYSAHLNLGGRRGAWNYYGTECVRPVSVDPVLQTQGVRKFVAVLH
jgi:hypothetical protein